MDIYGKLKERMQNLCHTPTDSALILAKVTKVDGQTCTVTIDGLGLSDIRLRAGCELLSKFVSLQSQYNRNQANGEDL